MSKKFTMLLASLFLTMGTAWAQTAATYADGLYKIYWQSDNRGYLTYHEGDYPNEPQLSGVTLSGCADKHYATDAEGIQVAWYLYTSKKSGKSYLFEATTGKFIAINPNQEAANGRTCVLTTDVSFYTQMNLLATDGSYAGSYMFRYVIGSTNYHFCSGCGSNKDQHPVRFSTDGQNDGGNRFVFVKDANLTITDEIKNAAIAKIEEFENIVGSTAENKIFYHIKNVRSNKYANYEGANVQFTQITAPALGSYWYLMEVADAQNVPEGYKAYRLYNAANALAVENPASGNMAANDADPYPAKVYCIGAHTNGGHIGVVIRPLNGDDSSWNDAGGNGEKIGTYSYDDPGSIWAFERVNVTEAQLIQNAVAAKTAVVNTLTTEATNTQRYYYGCELSAIEAKKAEIEAISVPENSLAEAMTGAIKISKNTLLAGLERIAPKAGDKFTMVNRGRNSGKDALVAFAAGTDVKCLQSPFAYFDAVWTLVATGTEGQFKLYNEKLKVYVGVLSDTNNAKFQYVSEAENAGVYELANVEGYATFKKVGGDNYAHLHQSSWGGKEIVRWDNGDASQWQLAKAFGPELTTDANNPICYALKSGRDGYYFTLDNNKVKLFNNKSIATDGTTHWYFMLDGSGNLKMYSKSDNKAMGYLTGTDGNTKLTNEETAADYDSDTYTLYFAPYNQTNYNGAWFALKPSRGDTYVSNHGGASNYMGFYNEFNDAGTRIAFENVDRMRLEAKVAECEAKVVGDAIGYYSVSGGDAAAVLAEAKAALQGNSNEAYRNSLAALNALTYTLNIPETGKYYRLKNKSSNNYMSGNETTITLLAAGENVTSTIFYLGEDKSLRSIISEKYLDCNAKSYSDGAKSGEFGVAYNGCEENVITYKNNGYWTYGAGNDGGNLDRGASAPNNIGYNWYVVAVDMTSVISKLEALAAEATTIAGYTFIAEDTKTQLTAAATTAAAAANALKNGEFVKDMTADIAQWNALIESVAYVTDINGFANNRVYTFLSNRNAEAYMMYDGTNDFVASKYMQTGLEVGSNVKNCQWAVYKSGEGNYYLYNLGAQKFMGTETAANTGIPFSEKPQTTALKFQISSVDTHPIMISSNGGQGTVNHSAESTFTNNHGIVNWANNFGHTDDPGNVHRVAIVGELDEATLGTIKGLVDAFEKGDILKEFNELVYSARGYVSWMVWGRYDHDLYDDPEALAGEIEKIDLSIGDGEDATIVEIQAAIQEIETIIAGFNIEEITPGFYNFVSYDYSDAGEYLSDDISNNGTQRILTTEVSAKNIFYYDGDNLIAYASGFGFEYGICNTGKPEEMNYFEFGMAYEPGKYTVKSTNGTSLVGWADNQYWTNNNGELGKTGNAADASGWDIQAVASLPVTIGSVRHATFYAPVAVNIPAGVKAYTGEVNGEVLTLTEVKDLIPAETPVILIGDEKTYELQIVESEADAIASALKGNVATLVNDKKDVADKFYTLQNHNDGIAFKKYNGDNLRGFRVYIELPAASQTNALRISFANEEGGTTGIDNVELEDETVIYDITGRRLTEIVEKGIYIVNGKKVVIK